MKTILIMRHAKSSWEGKNQDDWERPLSKRGKKNAQQIGKLLDDEKLVPDLILASSAERAHQTADIVMEELKYHGDFFGLNKLYMAEMEGFVQEIQKLADEINMVLVIGHNPCLDCILQIITGKVESLPTSAVAHLSVPIESWEDFNLDTRGELVHLWRPKDL
jgi:phosphohistidine phosphatase